MVLFEDGEFTGRRKKSYRTVTPVTGRAAYAGQSLGGWMTQPANLEEGECGGLSEEGLLERKANRIGT